MAIRVSKTERKLNNLLARINTIMGKNYSLDGAFGGWRVWSDSEGKDPLSSGYLSKAELYRQMYAFLNGAIEMKAILKGE